MINESFSDDFKDLWKESPEKQILLNCLEEFYVGLTEMVKVDSSRQDELRDISEINKDIQKILQNKQNKNHLNNELIPELVNFFFNRITIRTQLKIIKSLQLLFYSCNTANSYGSVLASRSIVENVAAYQYLISSIPWKNDQYVKMEVSKQFLKKLYLLGFGSRFNWDMLHSDFKSIRESFDSGKIKWDRPRDRQIPEISELNKNLDQVLAKNNRIKPGQIRFIYTILSDIIHPSAGGDFIFAPDMFKKLVVNRQLDENLKNIFDITGFFDVELVSHFIWLCHDIHDYELQATMPSTENGVPDRFFRKS
jgi:hypothetical protein